MFIVISTLVNRILEIAHIYMFIVIGTLVNFCFKAKSGLLFTFHCEVIVEVKDGALLKCVSGGFVMGGNGYDWFKNDIFHCGVMVGAKDGGLLKCVHVGL
jgi:hypothetical protein